MKRLLLAATLAACVTCSATPLHAQTLPHNALAEDSAMDQHALTARQQAILPITAFTAAGDMPGLDRALRRSRDDGLTINEIKEMLVQMYAYAGFPRSLNALARFMAVLDERKAQGIVDRPGAEPGALPAPERLLEVGTANQTRLIGQPVTGALFAFSPQVDRYLKEHLFGAIFARDNLGWQERELATLGALAALPGAESQVQSHMKISRNVGLGEAELQQAATVLRERVGADAGERAERAWQATAPAVP